MQLLKGYLNRRSKIIDAEKQRKCIEEYPIEKYTLVGVSNWEMK